MQKQQNMYALGIYRLVFGTQQAERSPWDLICKIQGRKGKRKKKGEGE